MNERLGAIDTEIDELDRAGLEASAVVIIAGMSNSELSQFVERYKTDLMQAVDAVVDVDENGFDADGVRVGASFEGGFHG